VQSTEILVEKRNILHKALNITNKYILFLKFGTIWDCTPATVVLIGLHIRHMLILFIRLLVEGTFEDAKNKLEISD
jgi:hypothetical protein